MKPIAVITIENCHAKVRRRLAIEVQNALDSLGMNATRVHETDDPGAIPEYDDERFDDLELLRGERVEVLGGPKTSEAAAEGICPMTDSVKCKAKDCDAVLTAPGKSLCDTCLDAFDVAMKEELTKSLGRPATDADVLECIQRALARRPN